MELFRETAISTAGVRGGLVGGVDLDEGWLDGVSQQNYAAKQYTESLNRIIAVPLSIIRLSDRKGAWNMPENNTFLSTNTFV